MKYPEKMVNFPSLINAIKVQGYNTSFLYGGDANFTNMRQFFATGGTDEFVTDVELNVSKLESKWGANDHITFDFLKNDKGICILSEFLICVLFKYPPRNISGIILTTTVCKWYPAGYKLYVPCNLNCLHQLAKSICRHIPYLLKISLYGKSFCFAHSAFILYPLFLPQ